MEQSENSDSYLKNSIDKNEIEGPAICQAFVYFVLIHWCIRSSFGSLLKENGLFGKHQKAVFLLSKYPRLRK